MAEIGVNAYAVWSAIKFYADYNTGHAWPGMRKLGEKLGLSAATVKRAIDQLEASHMVRIVASSTASRSWRARARASKVCHTAQLASSKPTSDRLMVSTVKPTSRAPTSAASSC